MSLIVDASVALKWNVVEEGSPAALELFKRGAPISAPELVVAELTNALWKKVRRSELGQAQAAAALAATLRGFHHLAPCAGLAGRALELSQALGHPAYDCFYLALAEQSDSEFITADARLLQRLGQGGWSGKFAAL